MLSSYPGIHEPIMGPEFFSGKFKYTSQPERTEVTVGIGVLAESGRIAILSCDMRTTYPQSNVVPHDDTGKQWDFPLPFTATACVAGVMSVCQPLTDELAAQLKRVAKQKVIYNEHVEDAIDTARFRVQYRRVDWEFKMNYGITFSQWKRGKVPGGQLDPLILKAGQLLIANTQFPAEILVAGYVNGRILFYKASGRRQLEGSSSPGIFVIGTGGQLAMDHLTRRSQNLDCSLARSVLHVTEALDAARKEASGTVGPPSNLVIITDEGKMGQMPPDSQAIIDLKRAYADRDSTWSLQRNNIANAQVRCQILAHRRRLQH
jgi:hypothetical protein